MPLLQWTSANATAVTIVPNVLVDEQNSLPLNGSTAVQPTQTTTYVITATGPGGTATASATLNFTQLPPSVQLSVNPAGIVAGGSATLTWTTANANTLLITDQSHNPILTSGAVQYGNANVTATVTKIYTAVATNNVTHEQATATATLTVSGFGATLTAAPQFILPGQSATLNYAVTTDAGKTATLALDHNLGALNPPSGSVSVSPAATTTYTLTAMQSDGLTTTTTATVAVSGGLSTNIQHIVILVQAQHSFDNYFGMLGAYKASEGFANDIDGLPSGPTDPNYSQFQIPDAQGNLVGPYHQKSVCLDEMPHAWNDAHQEIDRQSDHSYKMDGFLPIAALNSPTRDPLGRRPMGYYDQTDIPYYYELATQFATSDRWFAPVLDDEVPNRMYLFAGTSYGTTYSGAYTTPGAYLQPTIFNKLTAAGVSWRYYTQDSADFLAYYSTTTPAEFANVRPISEYFSLLAGQPVDGDTSLAQVVFIERGADTGSPSDAQSDEAPDPGKSLQTGARVTASIINALLNSRPYWPTSVFFLTYDEPGGFYDHVGPQTAVAPDSQAASLSGPPHVVVTPGDFASTGMRVPLIVVSPWVKPHYNSRVARDNTALLKFIETRFNLTPLTLRDAAQDDMTEMFDFVDPPALLTPPTLPVQPATRSCDEVDEGNNQ